MRKRVKKLKQNVDDADVEVEISMRVPGLSFCLGRPHCGPEWQHQYISPTVPYKRYRIYIKTSCNYSMYTYQYQSKIHVKTFGTARMQVNLGLCSTGGQGVGGQPISHFVVEFEKG